MKFSFFLIASTVISTACGAPFAGDHRFRDTIHSVHQALRDHTSVRAALGAIPPHRRDEITDFGALQKRGFLPESFSFKGLGNLFKGSKSTSMIANESRAASSGGIWSKVKGIFGKGAPKTGALPHEPLPVIHEPVPHVNSAGLKPIPHEPPALQKAQSMGGIPHEGSAPILKPGSNVVPHEPVPVVNKSPVQEVHAPVVNKPVPQEVHNAAVPEVKGPAVDPKAPAPKSEGGGLGTMLRDTVIGSAVGGGTMAVVGGIMNSVGGGGGGEEAQQQAEQDPNALAAGGDGNGQWMQDDQGNIVWVPNSAAGTTDDGSQQQTADATATQ